jgi:hypothetical protein
MPLHNTRDLPDGQWTLLDALNSKNDGDLSDLPPGAGNRDTGSANRKLWPCPRIRRKSHKR